MIRKNPCSLPGIPRRGTCSLAADPWRGQEQVITKGEAQHSLPDQSKNLCVHPICRCDEPQNGEAIICRCEEGTCSFKRNSRPITGDCFATSWLAMTCCLYFTFVLHGFYTDYYKADHCSNAHHLVKSRCCVKLKACDRRYNEISYNDVYRHPNTTHRVIIRPRRIEGFCFTGFRFCPHGCHFDPHVIATSLKR